MPITKKPCAYCKKKIYGTDRREYCDSKCRQYAWRAKKKDLENKMIDNATLSKK
jgi:hypothetical protein